MKMSEKMLHYFCSVTVLKRLLKVVLTISSILIVGCGDSPKFNPLDEKIVIGADTGDTAALIWIAQEKGFFEKVGLNVEIKPYSAGKLAADALTAGEVDIATCAEFVVVKKSFDEPDLRILGSIAASENTWVVGRKDRGIELPEDIKGKRIGVTIGSTGEYFLGRFLGAHDLSLEDIKPVDLPPPQIVEQMINGTIDAAITWHPNIHTIEKTLGDNVVSYKGQEEQAFYFILLSVKSWVDDHPIHAERLMNALIMAEQWMNDSQQQVKSFVARMMNLDLDYADKSLQMYRWKLNFPQALLVAMDAEKRWAIKRGIVRTDEQPDFTDFIAPEALEKVRKDSVTVIR